MSSILELESFDLGANALPPSTENQPDKGYEAGYVAGVAAAEASLIAAQTKALEDILQSIQLQQQTLAAAQAEVVRGVTPLLHVMIETLLPEALVPALHARLRDLVEDALNQDVGAELLLKVAADQVDMVTALLADTCAERVRIIAEPSLSQGAAWIVSPKGETSLDLHGARDAIAETVAATISLQNQTSEVS